MGEIVLPPEIILSDKRPRTAIAIDKTSGVKQRSSTAREVALVGQMTTDGEGLAETPYMLLREDDGAKYFGARSNMDIACRAAFKAHPFVKLTGVGVTDAGDKADGTVVFTTTAAGNTTFRLRVAGKEVSFAVADGDTITDIGDALEEAINTSTVVLPVTANNAAGTVTVTATCGGTIGNGITMYGGFDSDVTTTVTIAAALTGGSGSVDIEDALTALTGKRYHEVALLIDDSTGGADGKDHADSEGDAEHGHGTHVHQAIVDDLTAATDLATTINGTRNVVAALQGSESWVVEVVAAFAAIVSREEVPTRPLNGTVLKGILPPPVELRWTALEQRTLLDNGVTPLIVTPGEEVAIQRLVSTGVTNDNDNLDYSLLDVPKMRGLDYFRDNLVLMFNTNYKVARWADSDPDGLLPNDVATPEKVLVDVIDVARDMEEFGVLSNVKAHEDEFVVEKLGSACYFTCPAVVVDGMHEKLGKIVYRLS